MLSKCNITAGYVLIAIILTALSLTGPVAAIMTSMHQEGYYAYLAGCVALVAIGALSVLFLGAEAKVVMAVGTVCAFILLTANLPTMLLRYLTLAAVLFAIGIYGMTTSRNAVRVLMSIELLLNAANINFIAFARYIDPTFIRGQVFAIFVLTIAAAEAAVGLAIVLAIYRNNATVDMSKFNLLKW